jgi:hypothetical protein
MPKPRRAAAQAAQPSAERIEALAARERAAFELVCPATTVAQIEHLVAAFDDVTGQLHA